MNPKGCLRRGLRRSNVYRKLALRALYDSEGVAGLRARNFFYKYAIPSGLAVATRIQNRYKFIFEIDTDRYKCGAKRIIHFFLPDSSVF